MATARWYIRGSTREGFAPRSYLELRIANLEAEIRELREWLTELADNLVDRTQQTNLPD